MKNKSEWTKQCPECNSLQSYGRKYELYRAIRKNAPCDTCNRKKPSTRKQNLTGRTYARLKVLSFHEKRGINQYWKCKCNCGEITIIRHSHLTRGTIRSCGCSHFYLRSKHPHWSGIGEMSGSYIHSVKQSTIKRNLKFNLTKEEMWDIFLKQNRKCALSGVELKFQSRGDKRDGTASLDRIDSMQGYIKTNVQWVHKIVNVMKQDLTDKEFIEWCNAITKHNLK